MLLARLQLFFPAIMHIYYPDLAAIELQTRQLECERCPHCGQMQLVSHGYVYKKCVGAEPQAVGKRVICANRRRDGCGRTVRLYLDSTVRYLHYAGTQVVAFVLALMAGLRVQPAYCQATGTAEPRNAWRWLNRLHGQLSCYRSLSHRAPLPEADGDAPGTDRCVRREVLKSTLQNLLQHFGPPICANYQRQTQRSFLPLPSSAPMPIR